MQNNFIENINDEKYFYSLIKDIEKMKVGFYSVGLYPASLAYNCAMHGKSNNILLAPRKDREYYLIFHAWHSCMLMMHDINRHYKIQLSSFLYLQSMNKNIFYHLCFL